MVTDRKVFPVANTVGARIPNTHLDLKWLNVFGFQMVECVCILNGVWVWNGVQFSNGYYSYIEWPWWPF